LKRSFWVNTFQRQKSDEAATIKHRAIPRRQNAVYLRAA